MLQRAGRELHWLPLDGAGRAALDLATLGRLLDPYSVRSRTTIERIHTKYLVA